MQKKSFHLTCFARPQPFGRRMAVMLSGVMLHGFCLSIVRAINLGVDPCSSVTQAIVKHVPISFGTCSMLCQLILFLLVVRFDLSYVGFGTIGNMCFLGYISDFFTWIWKLILPAGFFSSTAVRYALMLPSLSLMLLGAAAYMCAGLGSSPYDALPFILSRRLKKVSFRTFRMLWDLAFTAVGFALGGGVGIVTVAIAFFCGPIVAWMEKQLTRRLFT